LIRLQSSQLQATKKMVNDGTTRIETGNFSATVDAFSITTFTSDPASQGGRYGNIPPVASGGGRY
jgi:hypothetical protein